MSHRTERNIKKRKRVAFLLLAIITLCVWLICLLIKMNSAMSSGDTPKEIFLSIISGIFDNILGILPPILIFDFGLEYLAQDYAYDEMSEQLTSVIMSNPEVIQQFDNDAKYSFLNATISAMVDHDEDECAMVMGALDPYIKGNYDLRKDFNYFVELINFTDDSIFDKEKYIKIREQFTYTKIYTNNDFCKDELHFGLFFDDGELDSQLRKKNFIIREALNLYDDDKGKILSLDENQLSELIKNEFGITLFVNRTLCNQKKVCFMEDKKGIDIVFSIENVEIDYRQDDVSLSFSVPQKKENATFFASISIPTYNPNIRLTYSPKNYTVKMFPFFNDTVDASIYQAKQGEGICNISIKDKWVHPMSGVVFQIIENSNQTT